MDTLFQFRKLTENGGTVNETHIFPLNCSELKMEVSDDWKQFFYSYSKFRDAYLGKTKLNVILSKSHTRITP